MIDSITHIVEYRMLPDALHHFLIWRDGGGRHLGENFNQGGMEGVFLHITFPCVARVNWTSLNRPIRLTHVVRNSNLLGLIKILCVLYLYYNVAFIFNDMQIPGTTHVFIPKGFELDTTWVSRMGLVVVSHCQKTTLLQILQENLQ